MFNFNKSFIEENSESKQTGLYEALSNFSNVIVESNIDTSIAISGYRKLITETLENNGNEYSEDVKTVLSESSKDILGRLIKSIENTIKSFDSLKDSISKKYENIVANNREATEKYQPLLKQLDTSRYTYTMPTFKLDNLSTVDMLTRLVNFMKEVKMDIKNMPSQEIVKEICDTHKLSNGKIMDDLKKAIIGVSPTINVSNGFYGIVDSLLVDREQCETKSFDDTVYSELRDVHFKQQVEELNGISLILSNALTSLKAKKESLISSDEKGNEYSNNMEISYCVAVKCTLVTALSIICQIIKRRVDLLDERSCMYRRVLVNAYEEISGLSKDHEKLNESYEPHNDSSIELIHLECALNTELF